VTTVMLKLPESGMSTVAPLLGSPALPYRIPATPQHCNGFILLGTGLLEWRSIEMTHAWQGLEYTNFAATPPAATSSPHGIDTRLRLSLPRHR
jgi:hypothetical protein